MVPTVDQTPSDPLSVIIMIYLMSYFDFHLREGSMMKMMKMKMMMMMMKMMKMKMMMNVIFGFTKRARDFFAHNAHVFCFYTTRMCFV